MTAFPLLVFDLDGTLIDSLQDLTSALNRMLARRELASYTPAEVRPMIGDGTTILIERAFAGRGTAPRPGDHDAFVADYTDHAVVATHAYPGIAATCGRLRAQGWRFAVCTNKTEKAARLVLAALGLGPWFAAIGGGDSFAARKPDPAHLLRTIEAACGAPERAVMTGDHLNDVLVARRAGLPSIFAAWGYGAAAMGREATAVAHHFTELAELAPRLLEERRAAISTPPPPQPDD